MGFLRLLLASIVLASHSQNAPLYSGTVVVEGFFIISGFYIQMILTEQYTKHEHWRRNFYISRFLRIFVPYWVILGWFTLIMFLNGKPVILFSKEAWPDFFPNIFIFGTEHIKLMRTADGCSTAAWNGLVIPQVWSVGIELWFYTIAPILLTCRSRILGAITLFCFVAKKVVLSRYYVEAYTVTCGDGLLNGIFPLELGLFTLGALGYRFYSTFLRGNALPSFLHSYGILLGLVILATAGLMTGLHYGDKGQPFLMLITTYTYITFIAIIVPFLFNVSRENKADRALGELSYPFYLFHLYIEQNLFASMTHKHIKFIVLEMFTIACAYMVNRWVEKPLDRLRHTRFR